MSNNLANGLSDLQTTISSTTQQQSLSYHNKQIALEKELQQLVKINETISVVTDSIKTTKDNLGTLFTTSSSTNELLDLYIKIMSQNNFNQYLLNDPNWKGQSKDEIKWVEKMNYLEKLTVQHKEEKEKIEKELESNREKNDLKTKKLRERQELLKKRVYGTKRK